MAITKALQSSINDLSKFEELYKDDYINVIDPLKSEITKIIFGIKKNIDLEYYNLAELVGDIIHDYIYVYVMRSYGIELQPV